jgi:hypothetical protein
MNKVPLAVSQRSVVDHIKLVNHGQSTELYVAITEYTADK